MALKPSVEGRAEDFSAVVRLFRLLVRPENFDDPGRQKLVVETLLRETYPNDATTRVKVGQGASIDMIGVIVIVVIISIIIIINIII